MVGQQICIENEAGKAIRLKIEILPIWETYF